MPLPAPSPDDLVLAEEMVGYTEQHGGRAVLLVGPRTEVPMDADALLVLAPDVADRDVFLCGPDGFMRSVASSLEELGVPRERIHHEAFTF
ncbi:MAG: hypothetical protein H7287_09335 [Thermoleophilia bacterium]|nr:hypothetical protein [Thermoleophilia bacterium]